MPTVPMSRFCAYLPKILRVRHRAHATPESRPDNVESRVSNAVHLPLKSAVTTRIASQSCRILLSAACLGGPAAAFAGPDLPKVTISGGASDVDHSYTWTISHEHTSPIIYVEFPHYRASLFFAPEGWTTESTFLVNVGVKDKPGVCRAWAALPTSGITAGGAASFKMQVSRKGTVPRTGTVLVRFADGTEVNVPGVELPFRESFSDKYMSLYGLGVVFLLWVVIRAMRTRKAVHKAGARNRPDPSPEDV